MSTSCWREPDEPLPSGSPLPRGAARQALTIVYGRALIRIQRRTEAEDGASVRHFGLLTGRPETVARIQVELPSQAHERLREFDSPAMSRAQPTKSRGGGRRKRALRIFVNYRREDSSGHAGRLYDDLAERFGSDEIFIDIDKIEPGLDFGDSIERALDSCDVVLAVIGRQWLSLADTQGRRRLDNPDDYVRLELEAALAHGTRVIPIRVQGTEMPSSVDLPDSLRALARRHAVELSDTRWRYDVESLAAVLERISADNAERERLELQKIAEEGAERERIAEEERERIAEAERERAAQENAERESAEEAELARIAAAEAEAERARIAAAEAEAERGRAEEAERERLAAAEAEAERSALRKPSGSASRPPRRRRSGYALSGPGASRRSAWHRRKPSARRSRLKLLEGRTSRSD